MKEFRENKQVFTQEKAKSKRRGTKHKEKKMRKMKLLVHNGLQKTLKGIFHASNMHTKMLNSVITLVISIMTHFKQTNCLKNDAKGCSICEKMEDEVNSKSNFLEKWRFRTLL